MKVPLPPPKWVRRVFVAPIYVLGVVALLTAAPFLLIAVAFASRYVPGKWRPLRVLWFLLLFIVVDAIGVVLLFFAWVITGFGWKMQEEWAQNIHYWIFGWVLRRIVASAKFTFKVRTVADSEPPVMLDSGRRPILVLSRHAGPGDSILVMDGLMSRFGRRPRIVLKEFMQWDPTADIVLNRVPSAFVPLRHKAGDPVIEAIEEMSATMSIRDAFVIFPEGGNYTENRHLRAIQKLKEIGRPDLAERATTLENTLPPKPKGVMSALAVAPPKTDVFFVGHAGLETLEAPGDIWRSMPMDTQIATKLWYVPSEQIPPPEEQEMWLYDIWAEIDEWISRKLSDTAEPFDEDDHY